MAAKKKTKTSKKTEMCCTDPARLIGTWFGLGKIKFAPGTWGSLGAFPVVAFVFAMSGGHSIFLWMLVATIIVFFAGLWASEVYANNVGSADPSEVVVDEVAGQLLAVTLITYNVGANVVAPHIIIPYLVIFLLFRYFDIWKPWPCNALEKNFKGGLGIMLDDIMAAIYAVVMFYALAVIMMLILVSAGVVTIAG